MVVPPSVCDPKTDRDASGASRSSEGTPAVEESGCFGERGARFLRHPVSPSCPCLSIKPRRRWSATSRRQVPVSCG
jgi:hypothetical protein